MTETTDGRGARRLNTLHHGCLPLISYCQERCGRRFPGFGRDRDAAAHSLTAPVLGEIHSLGRAKAAGRRLRIARSTPTSDRGAVLLRPSRFAKLSDNRMTPEHPRDGCPCATAWSVSARSAAHYGLISQRWLCAFSACRQRVRQKSRALGARRTNDRHQRFSTGEKFS